MTATGHTPTTSTGAPLLEVRDLSVTFPVRGADGKKMAVHAVYARREHLDPKIRLFIDFLKESFGPGPYWAQRLAPWLGGKLSGTEE